MRGTLQAEGTAGSRGLAILCHPAAHGHHTGELFWHADAGHTTRKADALAVGGRGAQREFQGCGAGQGSERAGGWGWQPGKLGGGPLIFYRLHFREARRKKCSAREIKEKNKKYFCHNGAMRSLRSSLSRDWGGGEALPSQRSFHPRTEVRKWGKGTRTSQGARCGKRKYSMPGSTWISDEQ